MINTVDGLVESFIDTLMHSNSGDEGTLYWQHQGCVVWHLPRFRTIDTGFISVYGIVDTLFLVNTVSINDESFHHSLCVFLVNNSE